MNNMFDRSLHEECGIFGVFNVKNAANLAYFGLHALQHRGQQGCGIVTVNADKLNVVKGNGLVTEVFNEENITKLGGISGIGHVRYATKAASGTENLQPFLFRHHTGDFALAHNGNVVNSKQLKKYLEDRGSIFQSTSDSEILAHLIKKTTNKSRLDTIKEALNMLEGAFSFLIISKDRLYACRDKYGLRPLAIGKLGDGYVLSSETCAFEVVNATYVRDVEPGEIVVIDKDGLHSYQYSNFKRYKMCAMEFIYFARPDSDIEGRNVHAFRKDSGRVLYRQKPTEADIVIGVPDSSLSAAIGYAEESGIPYEMGLIKNKYVGRTFIQPSQELREKGVRMKLSTVSSIVRNKRVILVDDSIVRGTTCKKIVILLKEAGAKEVHVRITSPRLINPCFYGVDISTYEELISAHKSVEEVREYIGADSLVFLNKEGLLEAAKRSDLCLACFTGDYPTELYQTKEEANKDGKF